MNANNDTEWARIPNVFLVGEKIGTTTPESNKWQHVLSFIIAHFLFSK